MTAIQPGPGFLCLLGNLMHSGADDLTAAIGAHVLAQVHVRAALPDPYLHHWFTPRPGRTLLAYLNERGQVVSAQEMDSKYADDEHALRPETTLVVATWGGETK